VQVVVDGLLTNYIESGKGESILLLHGWGDSLATFKKLYGELDDSFHVLALDFPGFGGSQKPQEAWELSDYTNFLEHWLKKIGANKIYGVIGHSNGGAIAINALGSDKLQTEKLVLLSSAGIRIPRKAIKSVAKVGKATISPLPGSIKSKIRKRFYRSIGSEALMVPHMEETFKKVVSHDVLAEAAKLTIPTLIIYGDHDTDTPPSYGNQFHAAIKNSQLKIVKGAGHFVHHDQATEVNQTILEFLTK
jgi:pimeloyl-ACP methyl ester carboxylesterase